MTKGVSSALVNNMILWCQGYGLRWIVLGWKWARVRLGFTPLQQVKTQGPFGLLAG